MFVVDFQVGALDPETIGLIGTPGEEIGEQPGEDAPGVGIVVVDYILAVTQNGVSFACAGLAVCENATIVSVGTGFDGVLPNVLVDFLLAAPVVGDVIKHKIFLFVGCLYHQCFLLLVRHVHTAGIY